MQIIGYSSTGIVIDKAHDIDNINIGDYVSCSGVGYANHAEIICAPKNLTVKLPETIDLKQAAFTTLGSIAMQGVRQAQVQLGEYVVVLGLGLVGQITAQLLNISGCRVIGIDLLKSRVDLAKKSGIYKGIISSKCDPVKAVLSYTEGIGADVVIICASTESDIPINQAAEMARNRGRITIVGHVGTKYPRGIFYRKELELKTSRSYGPGRYDIEYEEKGLDYPISYVRWTEKRNMEEFTQLLSEKKIDMTPLISNIYPVDKAKEAYQSLIEHKDKVMCTLLQYNQKKTTSENIKRKIQNNNWKPVKGKINIAVIGCGNFTKTVHLPNLKKIPEYNIYAIVSATGINAKKIAQQYNAKYYTTDYKDVLNDKETDAVLITTRHNLHAKIANDAAKKGKHILLEKPMAINEHELNTLTKTLEKSEIVFTVGFNRRYALLAIKAKELLKERKTPVILNYRINMESWNKNWMDDKEEGGGRIIGEVCHFIDFCKWLTDSEIKDISAHKIKIDNKDIVESSNCAIIMSHSDGSISTITYTTLGSRELEKERIEIFTDRKAIIINDFKELIFKEKNNNMHIKNKITNKGHYNELIEFSKKIRGLDSATLSTENAIDVTKKSFKIRDILSIQ